MPPEIHVTRPEFDAMKAAQAQMALSFAELEASHARTAELVRAVHGALMVPQPGHEKSLLDRFATVTNGVEGGERTLRTVVGTFRLVVVILTFLAAIGITIKFGTSIEGLK